MLTLAQVLIAQKNALADTDAWVLLIEMIFDNTIRVAQNTVDIVWNGATYIAFPIELDVIGETSKGEVPQVVARVSNVNQAVQAEVEAINGAVGYDVNIHVVHTGNLDQTAVPSWSFEVVGCHIDSEWATFKLGAINPYTRRFPPDRVQATICRHKFKGTLCGYSGGETACDKTLTRCRVLVNSDRFGGFAGVGIGAILV